MGIASEPFRKISLASDPEMAPVGPLIHDMSSRLITHRLPLRPKATSEVVREAVVGSTFSSQPWRPLIKLGAVHVSLLGLMSLGIGSGDRATSLFVVSVLTFAAAIAAAWITLANTKIQRIGTVIVAGAFLAKLLVGILHWLLLLQPDYFGSDATLSYFWDYEWLSHQMSYVAHFWEANGILSGLPSDFAVENKNANLVTYNALLFWLSGDHELNYAAWNTLHSIYSALIVTWVALRAGLSEQRAKVALTIAALQPFGFISNIFWRDTIGQTFIAIAFYLLDVSSRRVVILLALTPIAAWLAGCQRTAYVVVVLVASGVLLFQHGLRRRQALFGVAAIVFSLYMAGTGPLIDFVAGTDAFRVQESSSAALGSLGSAFQMPVRFLKAIIGPFPWFQVFVVDNAQYMVADFAQQVLNLVVFSFAFVAVRRRWRATGYVDTGVILAVLLFVMGMLAPGIHSSYVSIGTIFLLPTVCAESKPWASRTVLILGMFLILNFIHWAFDFSGRNFFGVDG